MAEARFMQDLADMKTELDKLKEQGSIGTHTVHRFIPDIPCTEMVGCEKCHPTERIFSQHRQPR